MHCTKCGFKNVVGARFCRGCGTALGNGAAGKAASEEPVPVTTHTATVKPSSRPPSSMRLLAFVLVVAVAAAGYWWVNRPPPPHKRDSSGLYPINVNGRVGFNDRTGKTVIAPQFDETYGFSEGLAAVRIGAKFGYIDTKGGVVISPQFDKAYGFSDGLAGVQVGTKFGFIDSKGMLVITPQFDNVRSFENGRAIVKLCCGNGYWSGDDAVIGHPSPNRYGVIDKRGKYIGTPGFLWVSDWSTSNFATVRTANDQGGVIDGSGKVVVVDGVDALMWNSGGFNGGLAPASRAKKWGYLNTDGKWAIEPAFEYTFGFKDGLAPVRVGGRSGLIDTKGKFVVNPQYENIFGISEGFAIVETERGTIPGCQYCGVYSFLDLKSGTIVGPKFTERQNPDGSYSGAVRAFGDGLAAVKTDSGWGFIDHTGKMIIDPQFDSVGVFQDGLARVTALGKEAYITKAGAFIVDPFPGSSIRAERALLAASSVQARLRAAPLPYADEANNLATTSFSPALNVDVSASAELASGLRYRDFVVGTGPIASPGRQVSVTYHGWLVDGTEFDSSSTRRPVSFQLGAHSVVAGMDEGVTGMRVGGRRQLIVPPHLGYGNAATARTPANSILVFIVELVSVR